MYGTILYISFNKTTTELYDYLLAKGLDVSLVSRCKDALDITSQILHDIILVDIDNGCDDLEALLYLKQNQNTACIPIMLVSKNLHTDLGIKLHALSCGVVDFMSRPIKYNELDLKLHNHFTSAYFRREMLMQNDDLKRELHIKKSEMKSSMLDIKHAYGEVIMKLSLAAEYKDPETGDHINRVAYYSKCLAKYAGMDERFQDQVFYAAPMHDIGKIGIPDRVLLKQGALDRDEWVVMKSHSEIGHAILKEPKDSTLAMAQDIALYHHEKFDGSGYPKGLQGEAIPLSARMMAIADVYDALRSDRPYKKGFSHEQSYSIMTEGDDRLRPDHFDPALLDIFMERHNIFDDIYKGEFDAC